MPFAGIASNVVCTLVMKIIEEIRAARSLSGDLDEFGDFLLQFKSLIEEIDAQLAQRGETEQRAHLNGVSSWLKKGEQLVKDKIGGRWRLATSYKSELNKIMAGISKWLISLQALHFQMSLNNHALLLREVQRAREGTREILQNVEAQGTNMNSRLDGLTSTLDTILDAVLSCHLPTPPTESTGAASGAEPSAVP